MKEAPLPPAPVFLSFSFLFFSLLYFFAQLQIQCKSCNFYFCFVLRMQEPKPKEEQDQVQKELQREMPKNRIAQLLPLDKKHWMDSVLFLHLTCALMKKPGDYTDELGERIANVMLNAFLFTEYNGIGPKLFEGEGDVNQSFRNALSQCPVNWMRAEPVVFELCLKGEYKAAAVCWLRSHETRVFLAFRNNWFDVPCPKKLKRFIPVWKDCKNKDRRKRMLADWERCALAAFKGELDDAGDDDSDDSDDSDLSYSTIRDAVATWTGTGVEPRQERQEKKERQHPALSVFSAMENYVVKWTELPYPVHKVRMSRESYVTKLLRVFEGQVPYPDLIVRKNPKPPYSSSLSPLSPSLSSLRALLETNVDPYKHYCPGWESMPFNVLDSAKTKSAVLEKHDANQDAKEGGDEDEESEESEDEESEESESEESEESVVIEDENVQKNKGCSYTYTNATLCRSSSSSSSPSSCSSSSPSFSLSPSSFSFSCLSSSAPFPPSWPPLFPCPSIATCWRGGGSTKEMTAIGKRKHEDEGKAEAERWQVLQNHCKRNKHKFLRIRERIIQVIIYFPTPRSLQ